MIKIKPKELHTDRLDIRIPTYEEQYDLWNIQKQEKVNIYYQSTPSRFNTKKLSRSITKLGNTEKMIEYFKNTPFKDEINSKLLPLCAKIEDGNTTNIKM